MVFDLDIDLEVGSVNTIDSFILMVLYFVDPVEI